VAGAQSVATARWLSVLSGQSRLSRPSGPTISPKPCAMISSRSRRAARESGATDEDRKRLSQDYLKLYTKAARLEGILQDIVGTLPPD